MYLIYGYLPLSLPNFSSNGEYLLKRVWKKKGRSLSHNQSWSLGIRQAYSGHGNGQSRDIQSQGAETETETTEEEVANGFLSFSRSRFTAITRTVWLVKGRECWPQQTIWQLPELANWGELKGHVNYLMSRARRLQLWLCAELQVTKICFCLSLTFLSLFTLFVVLLFVATNLLFAY